MDGIAIIDRVLARGALVKVLDKPHLDLTSTIGKGLLAFLSALAQDERERIAKRASEGRAAAKAAGRRFGRKPTLDAHQQAEALRRVARGESFRAIARSYRVSHSTISRLADAPIAWDRSRTPGPPSLSASMKTRPALASAPMAGSLDGIRARALLQLVRL